MPADTEHPQVSDTRKKWKLVRDCVAGPFSVKAAGEEYLPKLERQTDKLYQAYKKRAVFFNGTKRTHRAMNGLIFRKPPKMKLQGSLKPIETDADLRGNKFIGYCKTIVADVCSVGRAGTLIDWSAEESRAYFCYYRAEDVINWQYQTIEGKTALTLLSLHECAKDPNPEDEFAPKEVEQWRTYQLINKAVVCKVWRRGDDGKLKVHESPVMVRKGGALEAIPFVFHNTDGGDPDIGDVPLEDLAHVNVSHYQSSADLENGRHLTGNPTPFAFGLDNESATGQGKGQGGVGDDGTVQLGSNAILLSDNDKATVGYLEFSGQGLKALDDAMKQKEEQMAALGARLIEPKPTDAEAFETVSLRATAEASTLATIGISCTETLTRCLAFVLYWTDATADLATAGDKIEFALNSDFVSSAITPEMLTAVGALRTQNLISKTAYFHQLQKGEFYPEGWTEEKEFDAIEAEPPMPAPLPIDPNTNDPETGLPRVDPNKIDPKTGKPYPKPAPKPKPKAAT